MASSFRGERPLTQHSAAFPPQWWQSPVLAQWADWSARYSLWKILCKIHNRFGDRKDLISARINIWSLSEAPHICHCNHCFREVFLNQLARCPRQERPLPKCFIVFPAVVNVAVLGRRCGLFTHRKFHYCNLLVMGPQRHYNLWLTALSQFIMSLVTNSHIVDQVRIHHAQLPGK